MARVHHRHRDRILQRDKYRCLLCGSNERLDVHHAKPQNQGGTSDDSNLITLCEGCHLLAPHIEADWPEVIRLRQANG